MSGAPRKTVKNVHALKSPFLEPSWPIIPPQVENSIIEVLLPLFKELGDKRKRKGEGVQKQAKKRPDNVSEQAKVIQKPPGEQIENSNDDDDDDQAIGKKLIVGFNSTIKYLDLLVQAAEAQAMEFEHQNQRAKYEHPFAVLVCKPVLPAIMTAPFPRLVAQASRSIPAEKRIILVAISKDASEKLAEALLQPRVNVLGLLRGEPKLDGLERTIRDSINTVENAQSSKSEGYHYRPVQVHSQEVEVSNATKDRKRKREPETGPDKP